MDIVEKCRRFADKVLKSHRGKKIAQIFMDSGELRGNSVWVDFGAYSVEVRGPGMFFYLYVTENPLLAPRTEYANEELLLGGPPAWH